MTVEAGLVQGGDGRESVEKQEGVGPGEEARGRWWKWWSRGSS